MVVDGHRLSPDTQAVLLLCGSFSVKGEDGVKPLTPSQYNRVESWLREAGRRPGDLLSQEGIELLGQAGDRVPEAEAALVLLERGVALALAVEKWANQGIWIVSRSDPDYPARLRDRLQHRAPPLLFGAGPKHLLSRGGLAVIGSRQADTTSLEFSRMMGQRCAREDIQIISGSAKGVDQEAMLATLGQGGTVVGIVSDNLGRATVSGKYRQAVREGHLVLMSACVPEAHFQTGNAMARNKLIYALSDWALVVCCEEGTGGTWAGATENLKHGWTPVLVRTGAEVKEGNTRLLEEGGLLLDEDKVRDFKGDLRELLREAARPTAREAAAQDSGGSDEAGTAVAETNTAASFWEQQVWPTIAEILRSQRKLNEQQLMETLGIEKAQAKAWLKRALEEKKVRKLSKPVRYRLAERSLFGEE